MNLDEAATEFARISKLLDAGIEMMRQQAHEYAVAEDEYRMRRASVYPTTEGTVDARKMAVDLATSKERQRAHLAEGMRQAAVEAVRARRAQLSSLQTLLNAHQEEMRMLRTGQDVAA